jgi:cytochrome c biogenesis protein CcmG, thiol:disulfide interchange protein DsbE
MSQNMSVKLLSFWVMLITPYLAAILLAGCGGETIQPPNNGEPAPGFQTESLAGGQVRVPQDYLGKVVAIRFWADWCPYCRKEMAELQPVYARLQPRGLEVLAVNVAQDRATVSRFVSPLNLTYPVLFDLEGATARAYGVQALPVTWLIDRNGNVRGKIVGETTPDVFERKVMELLDYSE